LAPSRLALAHPHVWVSVETTILYETGRVSGLRHKWSFDDMYTAMAIQGLDANGDSIYSREELAELAKVNIEGLKEFDYFTHTKLGQTVLKQKEPTDYFLEYTDGVLSLTFTLPLEEPVLAEAEGLSFSVYDESFFIAFNFKEEEPVRLGEGAPAGCSARVGAAEKDLQELKSLNEAFGGQLTARNANAGTGFSYLQTVVVGCKPS
jgi:ABC-type uncharacterized transport system substrate-binding protein